MPQRLNGVMWSFSAILKNLSAPAKKRVHQVRLPVYFVMSDGPAVFSMSSSSSDCFRFFALGSPMPVSLYPSPADSLLPLASLSAFVVLLPSPFLSPFRSPFSSPFFIAHLVVVRSLCLRADRLGQRRPLLARGPGLREGLPAAGLEP